MITRSTQFPQVTANGTAVDERSFQGFPFTTRYATYAADATFQLDLFGQLRRATESARAQLLATEYAQRTEILTLVSDVASDYFALLALDLQLQITRDTITTQEDAVKLTQFRLDHGVATKLDVLFGLQDVELRGDTVVQAELRQLDGVFLGRDRIASDLELQVQGKKREIVTGHVAHQSEDFGPLGILGSQKLGARRFGGASQLAKKVQLKRRVSGVGCISGCKGETLDARFIPCWSVCGYFPELVRAGDHQLSPRLGDSLCDRLEVVVLLESPPDQVL